MLEEEIRRDDFGEGWALTRGWVIQRVFSHDIWHCAELNEVLASAGRSQIDFWG